MSISAVASSGPQPPTLASLLQVNRINPITGRDADEVNGRSVSGVSNAAAKASEIPKMVRDVLKTLAEMGASVVGGKASGSAGDSVQVQDIKKTAMDFLSSVMSAVAPQGDSSSSKTASPLEQLKAGISQMVSQATSGLPMDSSVVQSAEKLFKAVGLPVNANTLGGLFEALQKSIVDDSGTGSLVNMTA